MKYNDYTKLQLIELCKSKNIKNYSKLNKEQLIQLLNKSKNGGTKKNMNNYIEKKKKQLGNITTTNNNKEDLSNNHKKLALFYQITSEIENNTYFDLLSYFKDENKDFLDFIIDKRKDDLHNIINYKLRSDGRHIDHWEYVISIIKKEKTISLFDFYIIWTGASGCNIYNEDKINYYKTIIQEIKNYKNNNKLKKFDDFMVHLKQKLKKNNNLKEIFKPYLTRDLSSRINKIKNIKNKNNKNLISDGDIKIINEHIEKQKKNKFEYIELEKDHFIYNQLKDIWEGIDNKKSFIELVTGIAYKKNINNQKIKTLYKVGNNIYLSRNKFMNKIQSDKELKFVYDESIQIMNRYNLSPNMADILMEIYVKENNIKSMKLLGGLYGLKYITIKKFQNKKYKNLLTAFYNRALSSNNIGVFLSTKNINTNQHRDYSVFAEINYYSKNNNNYNSIFLYKMYLIYNHELIPKIRVKYYKKLYIDMLEYKNNHPNNNFNGFMTNFRNKIKSNNFELNEAYEIYITKFKYCKNKINNNKKIDTMYKDLRMNTALYKKWEIYYQFLKRSDNLKLIDFILFIENYSTISVNIQNDDFNELYTYKIYNNSNSITPKRIKITKTEDLKIEGVKELRDRIIEFDTLSNNIEDILKKNNKSDYKNISTYTKYKHIIDRYLNTNNTPNNKG
jgi:hypothetical protein